MAENPNEHQVTDDQHLPGIAAARGFPDYRKVWDYSGNAALRQLRGSPSLLLAGDCLQFPPMADNAVAKPVDGSHRFKVSRAPLSLRVEVLQHFAKPLNGTAARLTIEPKPLAAALDGYGGIEAPIAAAATSATLYLDSVRAVSDTTGTLVMQLDLVPGRLDPLDTSSGEYQRLRNLGYHTGPMASADDDTLRSAIEEFQCDHGLTVDGVCGGQTRAKLKSIHGC